MTYVTYYIQVLPPDIRALLVEPSNPQTLIAVLRVEKCHFLTLLRVEKQGQRLEPSNPTRKLL
mgnify:CR=1 FL=1